MTAPVMAAGTWANNAELIRTELVPANRWKKAMGVTADKRSSRDVAARRWPTEAHRFARVRDDGRAEAALLAEYGRRCGG